MQTLLTVHSLTYAQKGQRLLDRHWIRSSLRRTPEQYAARGCSYGLIVQGDGEKARRVLESAGIRVLGRYPYAGRQGGE